VLSLFLPVLLLLLLLPLILKIFASRIFSLSRAELWFVAGIHAGRIGITVLLTATLWARVLPETPFVYWMLLQTLRLLVSRLPLVPNKDILFASAAILIIGHDSKISALMSLIAMAMVALHLITFVLLLLGDGIARSRRIIHARRTFYSST